MAILQAFSMYDEKAEAFVRPFYMPNEALAVRAIVTQASGNIDNPFMQHPSDYVLYHVGWFDEETAESGQKVPPIRIGSVKELLPVDDETVRLVETKPGELKHG